MTPVTLRLALHFGVYNGLCALFVFWLSAFLRPFRSGHGTCCLARSVGGRGPGKGHGRVRRTGKAGESTGKAGHKFLALYALYDAKAWVQWLGCWPGGVKPNILPARAARGAPPRRPATGEAGSGLVCPSTI